MKIERRQEEQGAKPLCILSLYIFLRVFLLHHMPAEPKAAGCLQHTPPGTAPSLYLRLRTELRGACR